MITVSLKINAWEWICKILLLNVNSHFVRILTLLWTLSAFWKREFWKSLFRNATSCWSSIVRSRLCMCPRDPNKSSIPAVKQDSFNLLFSGGGGERGTQVLFWITDTLVLDFWWYMPCVLKPGMLSCLCAMDSSDSPLPGSGCDTCWLYSGQHSSQAFSTQILTNIWYPQALVRLKRRTKCSPAQQS